MSCDKGYKGQCCCGCIHQIALTKHPWNKEPHKGSIMDKTGLYACTVTHYTDKTYEGIISDREHGACELWRGRDDSQTDNI